MGLDMYLYRREYVSGWNFSEKMGFSDSLELYNNILNSFNALRCDKAPHAYVDICIAYWRQAQSIHNWFINELGDGIDECQDIYVPRDKLIELRNLAETALASSDALPENSGLSPDSAGIDEFYMEDMRLTVEQISAVLKNTPKNAFLFYRAIQ